jgi:hypothetical protein
VSKECTMCGLHSQHKGVSLCFHLWVLVIALSPVEGVA